MPKRPDPEQFSTRLDPDVLQLLKIYATLEGRSQREIVEEALLGYFDAHDLSAEMNWMYDLIDRLRGEDPDVGPPSKPMP